MRASKCDNCGGYYSYVDIAITKIAWCRPDGTIVGEKNICPECLAAVNQALENAKMRKRDNPLEDDLK